MIIISKNKPNGVYVLSADAKDLYDANHLTHPSEVGYNIRNQEGDIRLGRFINSLDYSLDMIKLQEVYETAYRRKGFSFKANGKDYSQSIINVTFKYSYKQFNQVTRYDTRYKEKRVFFVRAGYDFDKLTFKDRLAFEDDLLVGVCVGASVDVPVSQSVLGDTFKFDSEEHVYRIVGKNNKTIMSRRELREDLYVNGFYCDGIKYVRFKRSSGSSRVGKCLFIDERLLRRMRKWEKCGINLRKGQMLDLAAWEAYISLTLSSIIDTIEIKPENILLIDDYDSIFEDTMLAVDYDGEWLTGEPKTTEIANCIWDGQSLLDSSMFGKYSDRGMLLLRTRFFKSACFNTNLQQFFADNGITEVSQLNGQTRAKKIEDVKLVITPSSLKYLKFGAFDDWLDLLEPDFGIVKYDKPTHFFDGQLVQTHYQLLNTLQLNKEEVDELLADSKEYYKLLDTNPAVFRRHVGCLRTESMGDYINMDSELVNEVLYYLLGVNRNFVKTKLYDQWKAKVLKSFKDNIRKGHVLVRGTYATLFGNPYEMLQATIGRFNGESLLGVGNVYCPMFEDGAELLGSRSPHVAAGNILIANNKRHELLDRYFNLTNQIVCINSIKENILERLSGADMDSDTMLLTSNRLIVRKAKEHYDDFLVPTKLVPSETKKRYYTNESKADLDHTTADNRIGEIVNLSQELNSLMWDCLNHGQEFEEVADMYADIAKLDVLSNIEIDRAKKECPVDAVKEMKKMRDKYLRRDKTERKVKPYFFAHIARKKGYHDAKRNHYTHHLTTMDFLQDSVLQWHKRYSKTRRFMPLGKVFKFPFYRENCVHVHTAEQIFEVIRESQDKIRKLWCVYALADDMVEKRRIAEEINRTLMNRIEFVTTAKVNKSTIYWMMQHVEDEENQDIAQVFMKLMFGHPSMNLRAFFWIAEETVPQLVPHPDGNIFLYGLPFAELVEV